MCPERARAVLDAQIPVGVGCVLLILVEGSPVVEVVVLEFFKVLLLLGVKGLCELPPPLHDNFSAFIVVVVVVVGPIGLRLVVVPFGFDPFHDAVLDEILRFPQLLVEVEQLVVPLVELWEFVLGHVFVGLVPASGFTVFVAYGVCGVVRPWAELVLHFAHIVEDELHLAPGQSGRSSCRRLLEYARWVGRGGSLFRGRSVGRGLRRVHGRDEIDHDFLNGSFDGGRCFAFHYDSAFFGGGWGTAERLKEQGSVSVLG